MPPPRVSGKLTKIFSKRRGKPTSYPREIFDLLGYHNVVSFPYNLCEGGESKTKLNKLLYYVDMKCYKDNASPLTGAQYVHLDHGPVPNSYEILFGVMVSKGKLTTKEMALGEIVYDEYHPGEKPNLKLFTPTKLKILKFVRSHFESFSATKIREYSHKEEAYQKTKNREQISYSYAKTLSL